MHRIKVLLFRFVEIDVHTDNLTKNDVFQILNVKKGHGCYTRLVVSEIVVNS